MHEYSAPKKMKQISDLFEKYRTRFKAPQATVEKACAKAISEITGFSIDLEQISYTVSTRTISLQVPSVVKSELKFHYETILKKLESELGKKGAPERII
jgi:hypothetical protein